MGTATAVETQTQTQSCTGYGKPPWCFKGRAVYQLHLVKADVARALIPNDFSLVHAFGYTLGGFFLANYDHSPAGAFDELVVIAGIVWNPPTSCAWASKVLVNSNEACLHGRRVLICQPDCFDEVGLPSHVARFTKRLATHAGQEESRGFRFLNMIGLGRSKPSSKFPMETEVSEVTSSAPTKNLSINLLGSVPTENSKAWLGPLIKMSLPSFSGRTEHNPNLLKYSCQMECRVRLIQPFQISMSWLSTDPRTQWGAEEQRSCSAHPTMEEIKEDSSHLSLSVMLSKPLLALEFNCLNMYVEDPLIISQ